LVFGAHFYENAHANRTSRLRISSVLLTNSSVAFFTRISSWRHDAGRVPGRLRKVQV